MPQWVRWLWITLGMLALAALAVTVLAPFLTQLMLAILLATGLIPIVRFLEKHRVPHALAVPLTFLGGTLAIAGVLALLVPPVVQQGVALIQALPGYVGDLRWLSARWGDLADRLAFLPSVAEVVAWLSAQAWGYLQGVLSLASHVVGLAVSGFAIAFLLFYMLKDGRRLSEAYLLLVPPHRREETRKLLTLLAERLGRFTLGTLMDMTIVGVLTGLGLWLIGVPNALTLGVIVGVFNILPYVGATIGAVPGLIVAFSVSPQTGLMALAIYVVVQQLEGYVIYPRVVGNAVGLHPVYVLIALTVGTQVWGVVGVFLGIPAAVVIKTLLQAWVIPAVQRMTPPTQAPVESPGIPIGLPPVTSPDTDPGPAAGPDTFGRATPRPGRFPPAR
ncbi:MAG: AI-2E family transporter [Candidatus Sericytochromatia bacterium]